MGGCSHQQSGCSHMVLGGGREEPYGCTLYNVRLRKQDVTHFSDCHRCCLWVSVYCSIFSFHLFISEHTTALTRALIFPDVQIWDTSLHLSMCFGFSPTSTAEGKFTSALRPLEQPLKQDPLQNWGNGNSYVCMCLT